MNKETHLVTTVKILKIKANSLTKELVQGITINMNSLKEGKRIYNKDLFKIVFKAAKRLSNTNNLSKLTIQNIKYFDKIAKTCEFVEIV
jgi:hypothetical protein